MRPYETHRRGKVTLPLHWHTKGMASAPSPFPSVLPEGEGTLPITWRWTHAQTLTIF